MPTEQITVEYNELRSEILLLLDLKATRDSQEFELQSLKLVKGIYVQVCSYALMCSFKRSGVIFVLTKLSQSKYNFEDILYYAEVLASQN